MLAIIPARRGSKGLPGKNIKNLIGKPLIQYSIDAAKECNSIQNILVSTDSVEIAEISKRAGAWVPFLRPFHLATDEAKAIDVYKHIINTLKEQYNLHFEVIIILQPTSPLRTKDDIEGAIKLFQDKGADSVVSYTSEHHPIYWHKEIDDQNKIHDIFPAKKLLNRQDYKPTYYPNGAIYIFRTEFIMQTDNYYSENSYAYLMPGNKSVDIDDIDDFLYAEYIMKKNADHT